VQVDYRGTTVAGYEYMATPANYPQCGQAMDKAPVDFWYCPRRLGTARDVIEALRAAENGAGDAVHYRNVAFC